MTEASSETFHPTNGRVTGVVGLVVVAVLLALGAVESYPIWVAGLLAVIGVLTWAAVLRPGVRIVGDELELRNMLQTIGVPLGAIEEVSVRRVLAIRAGERRFVSPAISRSLRQTMRPKTRDALGTTGDPTRDLVALAAHSYPDYVEQRIRDAASDHRTRLGIKGWSADQEALAADVRSEPAWPELGALVVAVAILLVGVVVAL